MSGAICGITAHKYPLMSLVKPTCQISQSVTAGDSRQTFMIELPASAFSPTPEIAGAFRDLRFVP